MNSNWKLLSAGLLVAALAGCGGGGSDDMTSDPMPTPEDECAADGGLYEDGTCKSADDLRAEGRDAEANERDAADAAAKRVAMAKKLRGLLAVDAVMATAAAPDNSGTTSTHLDAALTAARGADNGEGMEEKAHVMVYNNRGPKTKESANAGDLTTFDAKLVMGTGFATGSAEIKEHDNPSTVRGSYNGATGGYVCSAEGCESRRTKDGILLTGGTWTFRPDTGQKYDMADMDYAEWGWWIDEGIADADPANDKVGAWYAVMQTTGSEIDAAAVTAATGTATYKGQAVGKAAYYHSLGGDSNIGGAFTADAELMADFDADMLSGSITGFDVGGMNPGWSVELMKHAIAETGVATTVTTSRTKWTVDGTAGDAGGSWSAAFYGVPDGEHQPSGVAGGFKASYESDGYMVGAFGAER